MNPTFLNNMSWEMAQVYGAVTDRLLINLAKYFPFIQKSGEVMGSFEYQARMLAKMGQVHRESVQIIMQHMKGADQALADILIEAIKEAIKPIEPGLRKAAEKGLLMGPGFLPPEVSPSMMQAFQAYYKQSADNLNLVNTVMLDSTDEAYRKTVADVSVQLQQTQLILNEETGMVVTGVDSYNTAIRRSVERMVDNGLTGFVDRGGHHWSPETYAAMDIKTTVMNTSRAAVWERQEQYGSDLYQVSWHDGARPLCYPWQGKVISRDDLARDVQDDQGNTVHVYAQSETTYGEPAGLFGINCGHYPIPFIPGFSRIREPQQDEEQNAKEYELAQEQRRLERELRYEKRDLAILKAQGADEDVIRAQRQRVRQASDKIEDFCDENGLARKRAREYTPVNATWPDE
jgi:hypothetical protein